jgi:multidrug transporter EmrE-like cation transporter
MKEKLLTTIAIKTSLLGWSMVLAYVILNSVGSFALKMQIQKLGTWTFTSPSSVFSFFITLFSSWQTWTGLIAISIATGTWIIALAHLELSKAYPVAVGLNLVIILVISLFYFQEPLTFSKIMGTILIFTGISFLFR